MKIEARIFNFIAVFCFASALLYAIWSKNSDFSNHQVEVAGVAALILSGGLTGIAGSFFWFVSRRIDPRPEDREDAEIAEGAGELGFFSPGSYWPIFLAGAGTVVGFGTALAQWWLVGSGVVLVLFCVGGLLFEYYAGDKAPLA